MLKKVMKKISGVRAFGKHKNISAPGWFLSIDPIGGRIIR